MKIIPFSPSYVREDGLTVIYDPAIPFPREFKKSVEGIVIFPPGTKGGNHTHPRAEAFYSTGELEIVWKEKGQIHRKSMASKGKKYFLFFVSPEEPHAIINKSKKNIVLVEFADGEQRGVRSVDLV